MMSCMSCFRGGSGRYKLLRELVTSGGDPRHDGVLTSVVVTTYIWRPVSLHPSGQTSLAVIKRLLICYWKLTINQNVLTRRAVTKVSTRCRWSPVWTALFSNSYGDDMTTVDNDNYEKLRKVKVKLTRSL